MSLLQWIAEVADDDLVLDPAKPENERQNTWGFSCSEEERAGLAVSDVVAAFEACTTVLHDTLPIDIPAVFYVWYDQQAGQLRCSTTSLPADQLPFGARVRETSLAKIVEDFLADFEIADNPGPDWAVEVWSKQL
jgi:hypothetical protein